MRTKADAERAGKGVPWRLRQHRVSHAAAGVDPDQERCQIARVMEIGLREMTQVFQVAIREDAVRAVRLQRRFEFRKIDAHHHGALLRELLREALRTAPPAYIAGQEQDNTRYPRRRERDR